MMKWTVQFSKKAAKQVMQLKPDVKAVVRLLAEDLTREGPAPGKAWPNYGKLKGVGSKGDDLRHCHLIKGKPTYVCCWSVNKSNQSIEVYYVGTHEGAPY